MSDEELGKEIYNAYGDHRNWKVFNGDSMPTWEEQSTELKEAWIAAAQSIVLIFKKKV